MKFLNLSHSFVPEIMKRTVINTQLKSSVVYCLLEVFPSTCPPSSPTPSEKTLSEQDHLPLGHCLKSYDVATAGFKQLSNGLMR